MTTCRIHAAVQVVTRVWCALSKPARLDSFKTAYSPCLLYEERTIFLQALESREYYFSPISQQLSLDGVQGSVNNETAINAAWERSELAVYAKSLLKLDFFKHLDGLFESNILYARGNSKLFEWSAVQRSVSRLRCCGLCFRLSGMKLLIPCKSIDHLAMVQT